MVTCVTYALVICGWAKTFTSHLARTKFLVICILPVLILLVNERDRQQSGQTAPNRSRVFKQLKNLRDRHTGQMAGHVQMSEEALANQLLTDPRFIAELLSLEGKALRQPAGDALYGEEPAQNTRKGHITLPRLFEALADDPQARAEYHEAAMDGKRGEYVSSKQLEALF